MREILFRGKRKDNGEWVYGWLGHLHCHNPQAKTIESVYFTEITENHNEKMNIIVDYKTIGQYTGLTDKNGKKIFEGDIVEMSFEGTGNTYDGDGRSYGYDFYGHKIGVVSFGSNGTFLNVKYGDLHIDGEICEGWTPSRRARIAGYRSEVIDNIHDNPELLKGGAE